MVEENKMTAIIDYDYKLTDSDVIEFGMKIGFLDDQDDSIENERRASAARFKSRLDDNKTQRKHLSRCIKNGIEIRTGECEIVNDYDAGIIKFILIENGKCVVERKMTHEERQLNLFGGDND